MKNENELKKMQRASLLKMIVIAVIVVVFVVFSSVAWFTQSREVEGSGVQMTANDMPFEIMVQGEKGKVYDTDVKNADELKLNDDNYLLPSGDYGYARPAENETVLRTEGGRQKIEWLVEKDYNAKNYDGSENEKFKPADDIGIRPGDSGVLHFWIVPKNQDTMKFKFNMTITPYKKTYDASDTKFEHPKAAVLDTANIANDAKLAAYIDSHILFFRYHGDNPEDKNNTKYSKLIDDEITEEITFEKDESGNLNPYEVKIYWIWPETLGEAVLTDGTNRTAVCATTDDGNELLSKLNTNPGGFMKDYTFPNGVTALTQTDIIKDYPTLSISYNNADQEIGDNILYLLAEMTVSLAD